MQMKSAFWLKTPNVILLLALFGPTIQIIKKPIDHCVIALYGSKKSLSLKTGLLEQEIDWSCNSVYLKIWHWKISSREQIIILHLANAMKIIPMQLAMNAGADGNGACWKFDLQLTVQTSKKSFQWFKVYRTRFGKQSLCDAKKGRNNWSHCCRKFN